MKKELFSKEADALLDDMKNADANSEPLLEKRKIYHTDRQYIVKVPGNMMEIMGYKEGDCLVFTLTVTKEGENKVKKTLSIEYEQKTDAK